MSDISGQLSVTHVIPSLDLGGAERIAIELALRQCSRGWEVSFLVWGTVDMRAMQRLADADIAVVNIQSNPVFAVPGILHTLRKARPDVVHVHLFPALYYCCFPARLLGSMTWVYTEHSTSNRRRGYPWLRQLEALVYSSYDRIVAVSGAARESLLSWLHSDLPVVVIENGFDVLAYTNYGSRGPEPLGFAATDRVIVAVGALRREKNYRRLVSAIELLEANCKLIIIGEGAERENLARQIREMNLSNRVFLLGAKSPIQDYLFHADVLAIVSEFEGFGLSALEAAAAGLPVVYADVPGLRDIVVGQAFPAAPESVEDIAGALELALRSELRPISQPAVVRELQSRFGLERLERDYAEAYHACP